MPEFNKDINLVRKIKRYPVRKPFHYQTGRALSAGRDHQSGDLFDKLGRDHGGNAQGVSPGVEFHDIRTDDRDFEGVKDPDYFPYAF